MSHDFGILGELVDDREIWNNRLAIKIYKHLHDQYPEIYYEPQSVKAWTLATEFRTNGKRVRSAIQLLIKRGFVVDKGRESNGSRRLLFARSRNRMYQTYQPKEAASA